MARIIYALSGEGHGHVSRVMAMASLLKARGHELLFCCGGISEEVLAKKGENILSIPSLHHAVYRNRLRPFGTLFTNLGSLLKQKQLVNSLASSFKAWQPDLLINDFEAFSWRAAHEIGLPVISFSNQQLLTHLPKTWKQEFQAFFTTVGMNYVAVRNPLHEIIPTFYPISLINSPKTTLIPPIVRAEVQNMQASSGKHLVVYLNRSEGTDQLVHELARMPHEFMIYGYPTSGHNIPKSPNLHFKEQALDTFLTDLASCRAVICTAGFTLISEALYLGKPIMAIPNKRLYEQWLNAHFVEEQHWGKAIYHHIPTAQDVQSFIHAVEAGQYKSPSSLSVGNTIALDLIEGFLPRNGASAPLVPPVNPVFSESLP